MTPQQVLETWIQRVNAADVEGILRLYRSSCVLVPTFSPNILCGKDEIRNYFEQLATRSRFSVDLQEDSLHISEAPGEVAVLSGVYSFQIEMDSNLLSFPSRFTFVLVGTGDGSILHHHSSQVPKSLT